MSLILVSLLNATEEILSGLLAVFSGVTELPPDLKDLSSLFKHMVGIAGIVSAWGVVVVAGYLSDRDGHVVILRQALILATTVSAVAATSFFIWGVDPASKYSLIAYLTAAVLFSITSAFVTVAAVVVLFGGLAFRHYLAGALTAALVPTLAKPLILFLGPLVLIDGPSLGSNAIGYICIAGCVLAALGWSRAGRIRCGWEEPWAGAPASAIAGLKFLIGAGVAVVLAIAGTLEWLSYTVSEAAKLQIFSPDSTGSFMTGMSGLGLFGLLASGLAFAAIFVLVIARTRLSPLGVAVSSVLLAISMLVFMRGSVPTWQMSVLMAVAVALALYCQAVAFGLVHERRLGLAVGAYFSATSILWFGFSHLGGYLALSGFSLYAAVAGLLAVLGMILFVIGRRLPPIAPNSPV